MKNYIYTTFIIFFIGINIFGQSPNWTVNENDYQYTMSYVIFANINGIELSSTNDKVVAFVNGQVRGVTNLVYVASEDSYYAFLTVFANANGETLRFKIYDSVNDKVLDIDKTESFEINAIHGNLFQAFSLANPELSKNVEIISFGFEGVSNNDYEKEGLQITIYLNKGQDVTSLNAIFTLNTGANLYKGTIKQISSENTLDFTNPIQFQVLSEDRSVIKQWTVRVILGTGIVTYYKKDAVCYSRGAIKVLFTENSAEVELYLNGIIYSKQTINNGETTFVNLDVGTYKVKVGGNIKVFNIEQKL
ncbi:MAG: hypothetical protein QM486_01880 [Flavobacteriaceae bacterium]